jgi:hypothetical protein
MAYPQAPIEMDMYMELLAGIHTKHRNSKDHAPSYLPTSMGKCKLATFGIITLSPNYERSTSSSLLLTIASSTGMMSFLLSMSMMESSWDHQTSNYVASSMSYRTSSCPLKMKATLRIMLKLISRSSRMASLDCCNDPSLTLPLLTWH